WIRPMPRHGAQMERDNRVVPGVRPVWAAADDHKRVLTPGDAIALGADYLVIGRPIVASPRPAEAAQRIVEEIAAADA
ncbi:MAG TPA: orotidine 5'-phosphate decarboxylase, partial [Rhodospirillales bacterium]|nr:orotidine 5'-phosphate decarboxylase [Rhodospirillales bacterium]